MVVAVVKVQEAAETAASLTRRARVSGFEIRERSRSRVERKGNRLKNQG